MSHEPTSSTQPEVPPAYTGIKRIFKATKYSQLGLQAAWKNEAAFRQEIVASIVLGPWILICDFSTIERLMLFFSMMFVIVVELLNSGIEAAIDRFGGEYHELSGRAKDLGSAAVGLSIILALTVWGSLFYELFNR